MSLCGARGSVNRGARRIELRESRDEDAVEEILRAHPDHAATIRAQLDPAWCI